MQHAIYAIAIGFQGQGVQGFALGAETRYLVNNAPLSWKETELTAAAAVVTAYLAKHEQTQRQKLAAARQKLIDTLGQELVDAGLFPLEQTYLDKLPFTLAAATDGSGVVITDAAATLREEILTAVKKKL